MCVCLFALCKYSFSKIFATIIWFGNLGASNTRYTLFLISPTIFTLYIYFDHRYRIPGISCDLFTRYKNSTDYFYYTLAELKDYYFLLLLFLYKILLLLFVIRTKFSLPPEEYVQHCMVNSSLKYLWMYACTNFV